MSDVTSYRLISKAAEKLYGTCVARQRTQGGYIRDIGKREFDVVPHLLFQEVSIHPGDISTLYRNQLMLDAACIPFSTFFCEKRSILLD